MTRLTLITVCFLVVLPFILVPAVLFADENTQIPTWPEPNWDRDLALQAAARSDTAAEADRLFNLSQKSTGPETMEALIAFTSRSDWPAPAREATIYRFMSSLRDLPPFSIDSGVVEFLLGYENQVLVAHEESGTTAVPLYPIRASARGLVNQWTRQAVAADAADLLRNAPEQLLELYAANEDPNVRAGIESAVSNASQDAIQTLLDSGMPLLSAEPGLTGLMGKLAVESGNLQALSEVFVYGAGSALVELGRQAVKRFPASGLDALLASTENRASASTAAMLSAELAPHNRNRLDLARSQLQQQADPGSQLNANDEAIVEWTEGDGELGLGYPVPIPVDTALPFDGFRSYSGLHARHQDLMATTDIVHGEVVGTTHNGREIWAYRIGDVDLLTRDGLPEPATLTNGGIHAREWQTPEVVTGIMELFAERQGDHHFYDFLLENVNMVLLPVQNVDGFVQTQRYPAQNWLYTDPFDLVDDPQPSPRDGRMRRKNMPGVDEILATREDHLFGVDLNRNHPPLWSLNLNRSSPDNRSLVYYGPAAHSEPETQALLAAGALGPTCAAEGLSPMYIPIRRNFTSTAPAIAAWPTTPSEQSRRCSATIQPYPMVLPMLSTPVPRRGSTRVSGRLTNGSPPAWKFHPGGLKSSPALASRACRAVRRAAAPITAAWRVTAMTGSSCRSPRSDGSGKSWPVASPPSITTSPGRLQLPRFVLSMSTPRRSYSKRSGTRRVQAGGRFT